MRYFKKITIAKLLSLTLKKEVCSWPFSYLSFYFLGENMDEARTATWDPNTEVIHEHTKEAGHWYL